MKNLSKLTIICLLAILIGQQAAAQMSSSDWQSFNNRAALLNFLMYKKTKEEGGNLKKWWRGESNIGIALSGPVKFSERSFYDTAGSYGGVPFDTTIKGSARPLLGLHVNGNSNHLLARLSSNSMISLSQGMEVDILRWKIDGFTDDGFKTSSQTLVYGQFGIPITIDYKMGCDVDFDPDQKTCFAFGAGAMPTIYGAWLNNSAAARSGFKISPYFYASFGFYAWGCWKVRASFTPGKLSLFKDEANKFTGNGGSVDVQGNSIIGIAISRMEYSADWREGRGTRGGGIGGGGRRRVHNRGNGRMF